VDTPRDERKSPPTDSTVSAETVPRAAHQNRDLVEQTASRQEHELREILDLVPHHIVVLGSCRKAHLRQPCCAGARVDDRVRTDIGVRRTGPRYRAPGGRRHVPDGV
jgi:hypothetical protein